MWIPTLFSTRDIVTFSVWEMLTTSKQLELSMQVSTNFTLWDTTLRDSLMDLPPTLNMMVTQKLTSSLPSLNLQPWSISTVECPRTPLMTDLWLVWNIHGPPRTKRASSTWWSSRTGEPLTISSRRPSQILPLRAALPVNCTQNVKVPDWPSNIYPILPTHSYLQFIKNHIMTLRTDSMSYE